MLEPERRNSSARTAVPSGDGAFLRRALIALAVAAVALLAWQVARVFVLAFAGVVLAVALRSIALPFAARTGLADRWSVLLALVTLLALGIVGAASFGGALAEQSAGLLQQIPAGVRNLQERVAEIPLLRGFVEGGAIMEQGLGTLAAYAGSIARGTVGFTVDLVLVFFVAVYLALEPDLYRRGFLRILPPTTRDAMRPALLRAGEDLRRWLLGQLVAMLVVGTLTGVGLWIAGVPMAFALAVIAGLAEFVPLVGPIIAAVPGVLVALSASPTTALWALLVYVIVQQIEGNVLMPMIQRWAVSLAPVLALLATVVFALLFGVAGLLVATPLAVVIVSFVESLYIPRVADPHGSTERGWTRDQRRGEGAVTVGAPLNRPLGGGGGVPGGGGGGGT